MWELFAQSAWKVVVAGLLLGAGLPAVFALGVRLSVTPAGAGTAPAARSAYRTLAVLCFVLVALAVALGITVIVAAGNGLVVSFEHGYPTLGPKP